MRPTHYKRRVPVPPGHKDLYTVMTVKEAAAIFYRSPSTIRAHIVAGNLTARRAGRDYIISLQSLRAYYGDSPIIQRSKTLKK